MNPLKWISYLNKLLAEICGWLLIVVTLFLIVDLVGRNLSRPVYGVSVMAMFVMIAIVYLGLAHAEENKEHVRVELLLDRLSYRKSRIVESICNLISIITVGVVIWAVWDNAWSAFMSREAVAGPTPILIFPIKFVMVVALITYEIQIICNSYSTLKASIRG